MSIWGKAVLNVEKGSRKIASVAATFSERLKAELAIIRLQIKIDEVQRRIDAHHRTIGAKIMDLKKKDVLPKTTEQLLHEDAIVTAMSELADRVQEMEGLRSDMKEIKRDREPSEQEPEETAS